MYIKPLTTMGLTFSKLEESTHHFIQDDGNDEILPWQEDYYECLGDYLLGFRSSYPLEASCLFRKPLKWLTHFAEDNLQNVNFGVGYQKKQNAEGKSTIFSEDKAPDGHPKFLLTRNEVNKWEVEVWSLEHVANMLSMSSEGMIREIHACFAQCRDPVAEIFDIHDLQNVEDENKSEIVQAVIMNILSSGNDSVARCYMLLMQFDMLFLHRKFMYRIADDEYQQPQEISMEIKMLNIMSEFDDIAPIVSVDYVMEAQEFGWWAPLWRQVVGDVAYICVTLKDLNEDDEYKKIVLTCSVTGVYENDMLDPETKECRTGEKQFFEQIGENYPSITSQLKASSESFRNLLRSAQARYERMRAEERKRKIDENAKESVDELIDKNPYLVKKDGRVFSKKMSATFFDVNQHNMPVMDVDENIRYTSKSPRMLKSVIVDEPMSSSDEEESGQIQKNIDVYTELPASYWQIQKLCRYIKGGNETATLIALIAVSEFNLNDETTWLGLRDSNCLDVLINILDVDGNTDCKIASLKILKEICKNLNVARSVLQLEALTSLVSTLDNPCLKLKALAAECLAYVAKLRKARYYIRRDNGICALVALMDMKTLSYGSSAFVFTHDPDGQVSVNLEKGEHANPASSSSVNRDEIKLSDVSAEVREVARGGAAAIWSCVQSQRNKTAVREAGGIELLASLLKFDDDDLLIPVIGTIKECASETAYRKAIQNDGIIIDLIRHLQRSQNMDIQMNCASVIFKCGDNPAIRNIIRENNGLKPLKDLLDSTDSLQNKPLLSAITGAIWKCAIDAENVVIFRDIGVVQNLVSLCASQPEEVLVYILGALAEMAHDPQSRKKIRAAKGIESMIQLLSNTNEQLLINVTKALGLCASDKESLAVIEKMDGVRLLWSLLKNPSKQVQSNAAWALCPCLENNLDSGDLVRSFVGGLELVVSLLRSDDVNVLAAICACISAIAKDEENLAVITDQGVVELLSNLVMHKDDVLRANLAMAIGRCCSWGNNRQAFGDNNAVAPLVDFISKRSVNQAVCLQTAKALHELSKDPNNCCQIHKKKAVRYLIQFLSHENKELQDASAGCIRNMRYLAMANLSELYDMSSSSTNN